MNYEEYLKNCDLDDLWQNVKNTQNKAIDHIETAILQLKRGNLCYYEVVKMVERDYEWYKKATATYSDALKVKNISL